MSPSQEALALADAIIKNYPNAGIDRYELGYIIDAWVDAQPHE